jgi:hypothetical protein
MVRPKRIHSFDSEQSVDDGDESPLADYLETITLLQEEVARLEQELQWRDERQMEPTSNTFASVPDEAEPATALENLAGGASDSEVERLSTELASRDETIRILLDELSRVEEAQTATRSEWEHLAGWVEELESRVEGQDENALRQIEIRLEAERQKGDALRMKSDHDRRAWEAQRQIYQEEIARLQVRLDQVVTSPEASGALEGRVTQSSGPNVEVVEALQVENLRLRAAWQELVERASAAEHTESSDTKLAATEEERRQLSRQVEQLQDQRKLERLEHAATVAELQARLSQASLPGPEVPPPEKSPAGISQMLEIDLRVRALRQHMMEMERCEKEERSQKRLAARISRLWSRTGRR